VTRNGWTDRAGSLARGQSTGPSARQRIQLRELLTESWQATVARLTALSIQLYEAGDGPSTPGPDWRPGRPDTVAELARLRWELVEMEAALRRLDGDGYGLCAACAAPIPFERLESQPHARFCVRCHPGG
jgi:hypothetical protein